jgi:hypothetical protein
MGADQAARRSKAKSDQTSAASARAAAVAGYGNADAIGEEELKIYDYFLASDQLEGRNFPSRGYDAAALYVASHLAEWGLKPAGSTMGTNGPLQAYFMPIEMAASQVAPEESKASLIAPAPAGRGANASGEPRATSFEYGKDWAAGAVAMGFAGGRGGGGGRGGPPAQPVDASANLIFAGNGYVIHTAKIDPYDGLDVRGKIIVVAGLPPEMAAQQAAGRGRGGAAPDPLGQACTDYLTPEQYAARNGALAVVAIANFQQITAMSHPRAVAALNGPAFQVVKFQQAAACPSAPLVTAGLDLTNAIFQGERLSGSQVFYGAGANAKLESFDLSAGKKLSIRVAVHTQPGHGENVAGVLEGSDPVLKNEFVAITAHLDHLGLSAPQPDGHTVYNGADDDGSGSTGLLGIAHAYAAGAAQGMRPKRSILFLWLGGEEKGLWGSQYFTEFPPIDLTKVVADLNMDMIGRTRGPGFVDSNVTHVLVNPGEVLVVGPNVSSDDLGKTIDTVNASYQKLVINHFYDATAPDATHDNLGPRPNGQRIFYRSDHYNFAKMGIPITFFTTGLHPDYHAPTDTPEKIDYQELQVVAKTVAAVGWQLAEQSGRPKLKENLPDQLVRDMKAAQSQGWGRITPVLPPLPGEPY